MNDLDLARAHRLILVLESAADDRDVFQQYREAFDHQEAMNPGFPETIPLGGLYSAEALGQREGEEP